MRCIRSSRSLQRLVGNTVGSFAAALVPAAFLFLRPMRVVGRGGGSYFGLSFCTEQVSKLGPPRKLFGQVRGGGTGTQRGVGITFLSLSSLPSPGPPPIPDWV